MLEKLSRKYRKEKDFDETLRRNQYRYEKAEQDARQKYGVFYKWKMRRKINKRSKN